FGQDRFLAQLPVDEADDGTPQHPADRPPRAGRAGVERTAGGPDEIGDVQLGDALQAGRRHVTEQVTGDEVERAGRDGAHAPLARGVTPLVESPADEGLLAGRVDVVGGALDRGGEHTTPELVEGTDR